MPEILKLTELIQVLDITKNWITTIILDGIQLVTGMGNASPTVDCTNWKTGADATVEKDAATEVVMATVTSWKGTTNTLILRRTNGSN